MKTNFLIVALSVALSGATAYGVAKYAMDNTQPIAGTSVADSGSHSGQPQYKTVNLSLSDYPDFTFAAENAVEAVVYVKVTMKNQGNGNADPFFQFFFGGPQERQGSGSGVIIRPDGYIVTNNHVVAGATTIEVTLNNNKTYEAKVIGTDPATDVALIKVEADGLPTLQLADSDKLRLGEWVLAIGSPLGEELRSTITAGIVSAKGRSMPNYKGEFKIESFIQTDAAVNPGNSGGALVNKEGQLVGINTAIISTNNAYQGYSFAVPSNIVRKIVADLIDFGSVKRAKLGISMSPIDAKRAQELKLSDVSGVYIEEVVKGGPADKAGLKKGDILVAIGAVPTKNASDVQVQVNSFHPGDKSNVTIIRDGKKMEIPVTFESVDDNNGAVLEDGDVLFYGASIRAMEKSELERLGLKNGVLVKKAGNGKMAQAGAEDGFVICYINDVAVSKPQDVIDIAKKSRRAVYVEGVTASGRPGYFAFGK
ncbi:MAG: trypsin-like peptidase domain-containing protein [Bacteroidales bacterium]|nr:trypsin-like peptidase domain-containing protein [Candidatus Cryptobacteroides equifaecalis]